MSIDPADVALAESLVRLVLESAAALKRLKADKPEVYAAIGQHHKDALARLEAATR